MGSTSQSATVEPEDLDDSRNPANDVDSAVYGWPALARIMDDIPRLQAFASFSDLNIKSLLYYQAELIYLRKQLHKIEWTDFRQSGLKIDSRFATDLRTLIRARERSLATAGSEHPVPLPEQWILIERIRTTLEKYNSALLQFSATAKLPVPDTSNVEVTLNCVRTAGRDRTGLTGDGAFTWGNYTESRERKSLIELFWGLFIGIFTSPAVVLKRNRFAFREHLVTIHPPESGHTLMNWAMLSFAPFYNKLQEQYPFPDKKWFLPLWPIWIALNIVSLIVQSIWKFLLMLWWMIAPFQPLYRKAVEDLEKGTSTDTPLYSYYAEMNQKSSIVMFSGTWFVRLVSSAIKTVAACLLPIVAISVLAKVHGINLIIGLIAAFTATFAAGLVILSPLSSRLEIFGATAGFSAVMVVFAQAQIGPH